MSEAREYDVVVAGAGLAGLASALAFARPGWRVLNVAPSAGDVDRRTTALLHRSVEVLDRLGIGAGVRRAGAPLVTMRIVDATNRLFRAPQVSFHASEIGLEAFGYNIENHKLAGMLRAAAENAGVDFVEDNVASVDRTSRPLVVGLSAGSPVSANMLIGADGRNSAVRKFANIGVRQWRYPQTALVLNFRHQLPHDDASTEFHTESGPFTIVPLEPKTSSLVWVEKPERAEIFAGMPTESLNREIEMRMQSILGNVEITTPVQTFPLGGLVAHCFGHGDIALVGEAAHQFPPIGAQGFNLGIRDVETLADLADGAPAHAGGSIGDLYHRRRMADVLSRGATIDTLNRSLLSDFLPLQIARSLGLGAVGKIPPLRRLAMREGVAPGMQADAMRDNLAGMISGLRRRFRAG